MKMERSCGGVVFTRRGEEILYVIIRHRAGHCGFPKGHIEPGETEQQTALREIREETALCVEFVENFADRLFYESINRLSTFPRPLLLILLFLILI